MRDKLLQWTLDARKALSQAQATVSEYSVDQITASLEAVDIANALAPHCRFIKEAISSQLRLLQLIVERIQNDQSQAHQRFEDHLIELDKMDFELNESLENLKRMRLEEVFYDSSTATAIPTLHDFIDDSAVEKIRVRLREMIDEIQESHDHSSQELLQLWSVYNQLYTQLNLLGPLPRPPKPPMKGVTYSSDDQQSITFSTLTEYQDHYAQQMASLLLSFASHFEQCANALKEFEDVDDDAEEDMNQIMEILERDGAELDDALIELESCVDCVKYSTHKFEEHLKGMQRYYNNIKELLKMLENVGQHSLTEQLHQHDYFRQAEQDKKQDFDDIKNSMTELTAHYLRFINTYDAVLVEYQRRRDLSQQVQQYVADFANEVHRYYESKYCRFVKPHC